MRRRDRYHAADGNVIVRTYIVCNNFFRFPIVKAGQDSKSSRLHMLLVSIGFFSVTNSIQYRDYFNKIGITFAVITIVIYIDSYVLRISREST